MAIMKRPSPKWDLSREQIEARARGLKLDRQHFADMEHRIDTARADASALSAEIDGHIRQRMASLSVDELMQISRLENSGMGLAEAVAAVASTAKADSAKDVGDGLKMTTTYDDADRKIRTFTNTGSRKVWMDTFRGTVNLQLRVCKTEQTPMQNAAFEARWREKQAEIASGHLVLPEIE